MPDPIHVEPSWDRRAAFARWCLAQTPQLNTTSSTGWNIPVDLYATIPPELLEDAYVDGFLYNRPAPQPVKPVGGVLAADPADAGPSAQTTTAKPPSTPRKPRKRAARKSAAPQTRKVDE